MESVKGHQSECESSDLCTAPKRTQSWMQSEQDFLDRVIERWGPAVKCALRETSERYTRFEEAHPKTAEILERVQRKAKTLFLEHAIQCYFWGGLLLTVGSYLLAVTVRFSPFWFLFVGNVLVWVPLAYSWFYSRPHLTEVDDDSSSQTEITDKPPVYESLPPAFSPLPPTSLGDVAPPKYEELFDGSQPLLHDSDRQLVGVPLCDVHQPHETPPTSDNQNETDTTATSPKSHRLSRSSSSNV